MVMPLPPATYVCKKCGWKKTSLMTSDAIMDFPKTCPDCGGQDLERRRATPAELAKKKLRVLFRLELPF